MHWFYLLYDLDGRGALMDKCKKKNKVSRYTHVHTLHCIRMSKHQIEL